VIADFARALCDGSPHRQATAVRRQLGCEAPRCLILTETAEHAEQLAAILPDWTVVTYDRNIIGDILRTGGADGKPVRHATRLIMTTPAADAVFGENATALPNVTIWAGGGRQASRCALPDVIVDVDDTGESALKRDARHRMKDWERICCR